MLIFYQAVLESLVRYGITAWFGNLPVQLKTKLLRLIHTAWKIIGVKEHLSMQSIYEQASLRQANRIVSDTSHVLYAEYELLPSGRRFRVPCSRLNRFKNSLIPVSINLPNSRQSKAEQACMTMEICNCCTCDLYTDTYLFCFYF